MYQFLSKIHRKMTSPQSLPGIVISVGNLSWGGTGKTPLCAWLAEKNKSSTAILTRGYLGGDEAELLKKQGFLVGVGKDRVRIAHAMYEANNNIKIWILDDGLQHWAIQRQYEFVTIDCLKPFGVNGKLIPWGSLREYPEIGLKRATCIVLHNSDLAEQTLEETEFKIRDFIYPQNTPIIRSGIDVDCEELTSSDSLWVGFSGIGNNQAFVKTLQTLANQHGKNLFKTFQFVDHHKYEKKDIEEMRIVTENIGGISYFTTEKDICRCPDLSGPPLYARAIKIKWKPISGDLEYFNNFVKSVFSTVSK